MQNPKNPNPNPNSNPNPNPNPHPQQCIPQLIIGIGGTGTDVVVEIARRWRGRIDSPAIFLGLDTDRGALHQFEQSLRELGVTENERRCLCLDRDLVQLALRNPNARPEEYGDILEIGGLAETDGDVRRYKAQRMNRVASVIQGRGAASQCVSISRMMLHASKNYVTDALAEVLRQLTNHRNYEGRPVGTVRATIFASTFGGTGSGCFLPILFILRSLRGREDLRINLCAFDSSFSNDVDLDNQGRRRAMANSAYVLRELDITVKCLQQRADPEGNTSDYLLFPRLVGNYLSPNDVRFDEIYLVGNQRQQGKGLVTIGYTEAKEMVAGCFVEKTLVECLGGLGALDQDAFETQEDGFRDTVTGAPRTYRAFGRSSFVFPRTKVVEIFSAQALAQLYRYTANPPQQAAIDDCALPEIPDITPSLDQAEDAVREILVRFHEPHTLRTMDVAHLTNSIQQATVDCARDLAEKTTAELRPYYDSCERLITDNYFSTFAAGDNVASKLVERNQKTVDKLKALLNQIPAPWTGPANEPLYRAAAERPSPKNKRILLEAMDEKLTAYLRRKVASVSIETLENINNAIKAKRVRYDKRRRNIVLKSEYYERKAQELRAQTTAVDSLVTESWLAETYKKIAPNIRVVLNDCSQNLVGVLTGKINLDGFVSSNDEEAARRNERTILGRIKAACIESIPASAVDYILDLEPGVRDNVLRRMYSESAPLYSFRRTHGMNHLPNQRTFFLIPAVEDTAKSTELEAILERGGVALNPDAQTEGNSITPVEVPQTDNEHVCMLSLLTGGRPEYSTLWTLTKRALLTSLEDENQLSLPNPLVICAWGPETEMYPQRDPLNINIV